MNADDESDPNDDSSDAGPALDALLDAYALKDERRTGWQLRGVDAPESVAAHVGRRVPRVGPRRPVPGGPARPRPRPRAPARRRPRRGGGRDRRRRDARRFDGGLGGRRRQRGGRARGDGRPRGRAPRPYSRRVGGLRGPRVARGDTRQECDLLDVCLQAVLYERGGRYDPPAATRERSASTTTSTNSSRRPNPAFKPRPVGSCSPGSASGTGPLATTSRSPSGPSVRVASSTTVVELQNDDCRDSTAGSAAKIARTLTTEPVLKSESFHHACPRTLI